MTLKVHNEKENLLEHYYGWILDTENSKNHFWKVKNEGVVNLPLFSKKNVLSMTLCFNEVNKVFEKSFTELYDMTQEAQTFYL